MQAVGEFHETMVDAVSGVILRLVCKFVDGSRSAFFTPFLSARGLKESWAESEGENCFTMRRAASRIRIGRWCSNFWRVRSRAVEVRTFELTFAEESIPALVFIAVAMAICDPRN